MTIFFYDTINKYSLTNIYQGPKFKKVIISLPLKNLVEASDITTIKRLAPYIKKQAYLLLFFYFSLKPFIKAQPIIIEVDDSFKTVIKYFVEISLKKKLSINNFFFDLFFETESDKYTKKHLKYKIISNLNDTINYEINFNAKLITPIQNIIEFFFNNISIQDLFLKVKIVIGFCFLCNLKNKDFFLKNMYFLWNLSRIQ